MSTVDSNSQVECGSGGYNLLDGESVQQQSPNEEKITNKLDISDHHLQQVQADQKEEDDKDVSTEVEPTVGFFTLFKYSSLWDKILMSIACIVAMCSGVLWPAVMILFGSFVDKFVQHATDNATFNESNGNASYSEDFLRETATLCLYNATVGIVILVFNYLIVCSFCLCAANQAHKIKCLFMASILKQDIAWFDTHQTGDFASRLTGDLSKIQDGIGEKVGICISFVSTTVFCTICGLYYGWKLALVTFSVTPLLTIAMAILSKVQVTVSGEESQAYGDAGAVAEEVLSSIRTVLAFGGEQKEIQRYEKCLIPARRKGIKKGLMTSIGSGLTWFCIFAGYALAFWYGVRLIVADKDKLVKEYTAGTLIVVFSVVITGSMFIGQTAPYFEAFASARGAAGKIFSLIQRKPDIDSSSILGEKPLELDGRVALKNVHFNYPARPDVQVLKGISLTVQPGETVALVGPSGCGKSTIIQLILRFYDTSEGYVEIDENDVKILNVGWLRSHIGFVGQEPVLFSTSIAENIRYGKDDATREDIEEAAKLANVHEFISNLPLKYETLVGDRGTQLSGGQKQRIAVARALVKNPKILLLDEATSALDTESEAIVQAALDRASKGRTTIIVAHRLSTVRNADKICVLSDGVIKEVGNHDELMEMKGLYYKLVLSQMNEIDDDDDEEEVLLDGGVGLQRHVSVLSSISHKSEESGHNIVKRQLSSSTCPDDEVGMRYVFKEEDDENASLSWMRLLKVSLPEWPFMIVGSICSLIMGLHIPIYGVVFGAILGVLSEETDKILEDNTFYCLIFLLMALTSFIASFLQVFMFSVASGRLTSRLRKMVFSRIIRQDMAWFDHPKNSVGSLCSKLTSDASDMQGATGSRISTLFQALSTFVVCVILAIYYNYKIGCVVFAFVPLILLSIALEGRISGGQILSDKSNTEKASKVAIEAIESIRTVASLHQEKSFYIQFSNALFKTYKLSQKRAHIRGFTFAFSNSVQVFAYSTAFYYGSILVSTGEIKYSDLYKVLEGIIVGTSILGQAVAFAPDYQKAKVAAARIFKLLDLRAEIDVFSQQGQVLDNVEGNVSFQRVHFNYPSRPKVAVLKGLDLAIESGKTIALVGSSGCGKSTCVQLIERFYDAKCGEVLLDDLNVRDININSLRSHIGLVSQEPVLFSYSIAENIAYGKNYKKIDMNEIIDVARKANIHNFITTLPQGYDTPVGAKGTQLSGGQKQRVAIARALLRDPKILLLDEATSALDSESERVVQEALDNARSGRTCLVIAHRLTTIQTADSIAVIHKGRIVERGTHQELLKIKGHYYKLYNNQYTVRT